MTEEQHFEIEKLYRELYEQLFLYANSTLKNIALAEEAVQDTFRIACTKPDSFFQSPNRRGWILNTLKYVIRNTKRRCVHADHLVTFYAAEFADEANAGADPVDLDLLYGKLAEKEKFQLIRGVAEGKSMLELAQERGISVGACRKRVQRAREFLKKKILDLEK